MDPTSSPDRRRLPLLALICSVVAIAVLGVGVILGAALSQSAALSAPGVDDPEVGFARAMQTHHNQGVELALLVRDRTDDAAIRSLAYDIATTQAQQSGQMYGWLGAWNVPQYSSRPPMGWMQGMSGMGESGMAMPAGEAAAMPGLATSAQIAELKAASGVPAERIFLRLMIAHHQGAVEMAQAALDLSDDPPVSTLAGAIVTNQTTEMELMTQMLAERE